MPAVYVRLLDTRNDARVAVLHAIMQVNDYGCHWKNVVQRHCSRIHTFFAHATHPKYLQRPPLGHVSKSVLVLTGVVSHNVLKKKYPKTKQNFKHQRKRSLSNTHIYCTRRANFKFRTLLHTPFLEQTFFLSHDLHARRKFLRKYFPLRRFLTGEKNCTVTI